MVYAMAMANIEERIAQWEQMAREAPDDMAYFSLGSAYREAERYEDAQAALAKAIELNEQMSRAYQLSAQVLIKLGREDEAKKLLVKGYVIAAERGDVMPQRAMGALLEKLGEPVPEAKGAATQAVEPTDGDTVMDRRTGSLQQRLPDPPMRGAAGDFIYDHFGQETWRQWISQGTKVINELRLDFSNPQHQDVYEQHMLEWLGVTPEEIEAYQQAKAKDV